MDATVVLTDGFSRIKQEVHAAVDALTPEQLALRIDPEANSIAWLVWHLARVQDDHVAAVAGHEQAWTADGWAARFGLPFDDAAIGYGQTAAEVAAVRAGADLLTDYYDAVHERTLAFLADLADERLDDVVDRSWDPPVTMGVRLVSVLSDDLQHVGQAAFLRGVILRRP